MTAVLDREQLRAVTMDDENLMREILAAVIDDTSHQVNSLAAAIQIQDTGACARLAHYSKGACANVGANRIAALLTEIEYHAVAGALPECDRALRSLSGELELLRRERV